MYALPTLFCNAVRASMWTFNVRLNPSLIVGNLHRALLMGVSLRMQFAEGDAGGHYGCGKIGGADELIECITECTSIVDARHMVAVDFAFSILISDL
jgi:hypothetical protein